MIIEKLIYYSSYLYAIVIIDMVISKVVCIELESGCYECYIKLLSCI